MTTEHHRTPSNTTEHHNIEEQTFKSKFNRTVKDFKKLQQIETTIVFLTRCQKENVLPPSFKLTNKLPHLNTTEEIIAKNVLNQTSKTLLKLALKSRKAQAVELNKNYWSSWHELISLKKNKEKDELITQIELLEKKITAKLITKSQKKFAWIKQSALDKRKEIKPKDTAPVNKPDKGHRRFIKDLNGNVSRIEKRKKRFQQCTTIQASI